MSFNIHFNPSNDFFPSMTAVFGLASLANKMPFFPSLREQACQVRARHSRLQPELTCESVVWLNFSLSLIISKWELQPLAISSGWCEDKLR